MKESGNDKDKEIDAKRPPWRTVSVSTLPKPDKSALLRAKLLDASRRMRAGKCNVGIQTDLSPTKLLKEVNIGVQNDLILYKDVGILTDGSYTKQRNVTDDYILTYSVSMMTDAVLASSVCTQTALPRLACDDFINVYYNLDGNDEIIQKQKLNDTEHKLLEQITKIREINKIKPCDKKFKEKDSVKEQDKTIAINRMRPTHTSWKFDHEEYEASIASNYYLKPSNGNVKQQSDLKMAIPGVHSSKNTTQLQLLLFAIDELIRESNNLVDIIQSLRERHEQNVDVCNLAAKLNYLNVAGHQKPILPSEHWQPIVEQQEKALAELFN